MSRDSVPGDDVEFDPLNEDELAGLGLEPAPLPVLPLGDEPTRTTAPYLFPRPSVSAASGAGTRSGWSRGSA
ncbi:hypothetical protein AB0B31_04185 [Catellatospora citrea]|uniref:hypothetical protein n=1 Tax=Catellatospora citrea TaxID=53366 RepID=UPI0033CB545B